jgi:hypothetical protein
MKKKVWELKPWDKWNTWSEILTFRKMDWMYGQWFNEKKDIKVWHKDSYELWEDWMYT